MVEIKTERLLLLPWSSSYVDDLVRIYTNPEVMRYISNGRLLNRDECLKISERGASLWDKYGYGPWAVISKKSGEWIGKLGLDILEDWPKKDKWEVGWELAPEFWGQGLATEGGKMAIQFGFEQAKLKRIISPTIPENIASRRVMEKCGLRYQGLIHWRGAECIWYAIDSPAG